MVANAYSNGSRWLRGGAAAMCLIGLGLPLVFAGETPRSPVQVKIVDGKPRVVEAELPVDPVQRIRFQSQGNLFVHVTDEQGRTLHLSHFPSFNIDGQLVMPNAGVGRYEVTNARLGKTPGGKERVGFMTVLLHGNLRITQTSELVPTKSAGPGQKRRLDAVLFRYQVENKGQQAHTVGMRVYVETYVIDNDGPLFAAPTIPGKLLDGMVLKDKTMTEYLQVLQRPDLKNPGFVVHTTFNLGSAMEKPSRVVLTRHGIGFGVWEMQPVQSMGDSAMGIFWEPREIKPAAKRDMAYAYGQGIAALPESEGRFNLVLGGSFEPGKTFTVAAFVTDPGSGQSLTLELPPGMERLEGKEIQPVPLPSEDRVQSMVLWKARVVQPGQFTLRVRSSTGVTQTKLITVSRAEGK